MPGEHTDGHVHAAAAVRRGAVALVCERDLGLGVTEVLVRPGAVRTAMAVIAAAFHGYPARALTTVGVTGTNGKTTVTQLLRAVLEHAGRPTGVIGTLDGVRTTPEAPVLQASLARLRDEGRTSAVLEVSSHALTQQRVEGIRFDVAAFTNLSRDHLDHHGTMEAYFAAKSRLFELSRARLAVIDVDTPWGRRLADATELEVLPVTREEAADIRLSLGSSAFLWRGRRVVLPLQGTFNVDNALVAARIALALGVDEDRIAEGLGLVGTVPGRMEPVDGDAPFSVVVDYAHTPEGLEASLAAARCLAPGARVICVFGCGGDRDPGKRPEMGAVATAGADLVVVTSDNPRSEDPLAIIGRIVEGARSGATVEVEPDRAAAIDRAVEMARPGDVVLLAGKGHERTQTVGDRVLEFDDRTEAARALRNRLSDSGR